MILPPDSSEQESVSSSTSEIASWLKTVRNFLLFSGVVGGAIATIVAVVGWRFVKTDLIDLVEENLSQTLDRPIALGDIEQISWTGIQLGASLVPATADDFSWLSVQQINIDIAPLQLLLHRTLAVDITLHQPTVRYSQQWNDQWSTLPSTPKENQGPIRTEIHRLRIEGGTLFVSPSTEGSQLRSPISSSLWSELFIQDLDVQVEFRDDHQIVAFETSGTTNGQGRFELKGEAHTDGSATNLVVQSQEVAIANFNALLPPSITLKDGQVDGQIQAELRRDRPLSLQGTAQIEQGAIAISTLDGASVADSGFLSDHDITAITGADSTVNQRVDVGDLQGRLRFQGQDIELEQAGFQIRQIPVVVDGSVQIAQDIDQMAIDLLATIPTVELAALAATFDTEIDVSGAVGAEARLTGSPFQPQFSATIRNQRPLFIDRVGFETVTAELSGTPEQLSLDRLRAIPLTGGYIEGNGVMPLDGNNIVAADVQTVLPVDSLAQTYELSLPPGMVAGELSSNIAIDGALDALVATAQWDLRKGTYPAQGTMTFRDGVITLDTAEVAVEEGTVLAQAQAQLTSGQWQATLRSNQVPAQALSPTLSGFVDGTVQLVGRLDALNPRGIRGRGTVQWIDRDRPNPIESTATLSWTGNDLVVHSLSALGLNLRGVVKTRVDRGSVAIAGLDLNVKAEDFDLATISSFVPLPVSVSPSGTVTADGRITGTLDNWDVQGRAQLRNLAIATVAFDPMMSARVQARAGEGGTLEVTGQRNRFLLQLDHHYRPRQFDLRLGGAIAQGRMTEAGLLHARVEQLPLELLNLTPAEQLGIGKIGGNVSGQVVADLVTPTDPVVRAEVAIAQPVLGHVNNIPVSHHQDDQFTAQLTYADGVATLRDGELELGKSLYQLSGQVRLGENLQVRGELRTVDAEIQDVLTALQWFEIEDLGRLSAPVWTTEENVVSAPSRPIGSEALRLPPRQILDENLYQQLESFAIALANTPPTPHVSTAGLPSDLKTVDGRFSTQIQIQGSLQNGMTGSVTFDGQDWSWGDYGIRQVMVDGALEGDRLVVNQAQVAGLVIANTDIGTALSFNGELGRTLLGQVRLRHLPLDGIRAALALPTSLDGDINAIANLSGTLDYPEVEGHLGLTTGQIATVDIEDIGIDFAYRDAMFTADGGLDTEVPGSLTFNAAVPFALPFMAVAPSTDELFVDLYARDQGLEVVNRLSRRAINWDGGSGEVDLRIVGTLANPEIQEFATFTDAQFSSALLPEPLTQVNGQIYLIDGIIQSADLHGVFGGGQLRLTGVLPLAANSASDSTAPLTLALDQVNLDTSIYTGQINGSLSVLGSLFSPIITGDLELSDGRLTLAAAPPSENTLLFDNLTVTLGDRTTITSFPPLFDLTGEGTIRFSGSLVDPRPEGTIHIDSGQVNLLTTRFQVFHQHDNQVIFYPDRGFDPYLDLQLLSVVPETRIARLENSNGFPTAEVEPLSPVRTSDRLESILIDARYTGFSSRLFTNLDQVSFRSTPHRDRREVVELIGGDLAASLVTEEGLLVLSSVGDVAALSLPEAWLERRLDLFEFNLFPVGLIEDGEIVSQELGIEVGVELTDRLQASVLDLVTDSDVPEVILRYQATPNVRLRGFSNFSDNSGVFIQFNTEF